MDGFGVRMFSYEGTNCIEKECYGCGACAQSCPCGAIEMTKGDDGFLYPKVIEEKCIECGVCKRSCQRRDVVENTKSEPISVYMAVNKSEEISKRSSSAGVAYLLSEYILEAVEGIVFGAVYNEAMGVVHERIQDISQLYRVQGSKYVQSNLGDTYRMAESYLKKGRVVLFTGTPCQIGGLYSFLKKDYSNLYTMDVVCFGAGAPGIFESFIKWKENRINDTIIDINFRDKRVGWGNSITEIKCKSGKKICQVSQLNEWYHVFVKHLVTRESCHSCQYTSVSRKSDITVGDFWGIEKIIPELNTREGVSKVLINTVKGSELFSKINDKIIVKKMLIDNAIRPNLQHPPKKNPKREVFFEDYKREGFFGAYRKYMKSCSLREKSKYWVQYASATVLGAKGYCKLRAVLKR